MNGIEILMELRERKVSLPTIVVSAFGEVRQAVAAIKNGAFDFLEKPVNPHTLTIRILSALRESARLHQIRQQQSGIKQRYDSLTDPELKILSCLIAGKDCEFIAESIAIEPQNPYKQIMTKMEAESLVDLVRCSLINEQSPEPC